MKFEQFKNKIDLIINSDTPEKQEKLIKKLYKETQALQLQQTGVMQRSEQLVCDKCIKGLNNSKAFEKGTCVHCRNKV